MAKFVPKARMSRRSLKEMARKKRVTWDFSPVTRKIESKKLYNRKKRSHDREDDYGMGVFLCPSGSVRSFHAEESKMPEALSGPPAVFHYGYGFLRSSVSFQQLDRDRDVIAAPFRPESDKVHGASGTDLAEPDKIAFLFV